MVKQHCPAHTFNKEVKTELTVLGNIHDCIEEGNGLFGPFPFLLNCWVEVVDII